MAGECRIVRLDPDLGIEAYQFTGIMQKFPSHFHDYYVVGCMREGLRRMTCRGAESVIGAGDLILFNSGEPHACEQVDNRAMDLCCLHIPVPVMESAALEITGRAEAPRFRVTHWPGWPGAPAFFALHGQIVGGAPTLQREEGFYFLLQQLIAQFGESGGRDAAASPAVQAVCRHIEAEYGQAVTLAGLAEAAGMNKYTLLRAFTRERGLTPYQYLETVRVDRAKALLEQGVPPVQAAAETGFADQSHFTRLFKALTGVTPGQYRDMFRERERENA